VGPPRSSEGGEVDLCNGLKFRDLKRNI